VGSVKTRSGIQTRVAIIRELTIPVAITVGALSTLHSRLVVTGVHASANGPQILVSERNSGQTFLRATGRAVCVGGSRRFTYPLSSSPVLPGDSATLHTPAPDLARGTTYHCTATLDYGRTAPASWHGAVSVPKSGPPKVVQTGPHRYSTLPKQGVPRWAIAVIAAGGAIVLALVFVIVLLLRRRPPAAT
jgi:hypothetical protein